MSNFAVVCKVRKHYEKQFLIRSRSEGEAIKQAKMEMYKAGGTILWTINEVIILEIKRVM